jgi:hypothetical protein
VTAEGSLTLRRIAGALFLISALTFATAATILSATFDWPDILREPADVVLTRFASGGPSLVWTWFATAWTYAILVVPILLLPTVLGRRDDVALWVATFAGAISVLLALIGFLRWHGCIKTPMTQTARPWQLHGSPSISLAAHFSASTSASYWRLAGR